MIALTGVTGKLGGQLARDLSQAGISAKLLARRPEAVEVLPHTTIHEAYYDKSEKTVEALSGVDILFIVSAHQSETRVAEHKALIDAAKMAGVSRIIYTSFFNAKLDSTFTLARDHAQTENYIKDQGFTYTFIRDNFYMDFFIDLAREYGEIKGPAGQGRVSTVFREDVAGVASAVLKNPKAYENQVLDMTGPESLSLAEIATLISKAWNKPITYVQETVPQAYDSRKVWSAPQWEVDSWVSTYTAIANGELATVTNDVEKVLGRKATSLADYLKEGAR
ncbi:NmrA-like dehydrogenase/reductase [Streptococcus criceti]|uniref:NmrA-like domain-containing protein n=1 Tax=Streptococcus criceti HS-6 TaxID=873449 RepID=G5JRF0_STRCG|nr:SDR family oxidoreductase [Streptococcus criceti]EHI75422.1 hypothetical protein STRCR_0737 [Streptococcus criceti HS-6]SUN43729.1 NmrA-like dehydrogenase/reductase [Streptococcus criceti]